MTDINQQIAAACMGLADTREFNGKRSNPVIEQWIREVKPEFKGTDDTAWCSAFVYAEADLTTVRPTLLSRSWLKVGVQVDPPRVGDVVVFARPGGESWQGHVGFYCGHDSTQIVVFGGNQDNKVGVKRYYKKDLLAVRRMKKVIVCGACKGTGVIS